jgi:DNA-binding NarL/FixJ family response regulator
MTESEVKFYPAVNTQKIEAKDYLTAICKENFNHDKTNTGVEILRLFAEGYNLKELSKMYGLSVTNIKNFMFFARKKLKVFD